MRHALVVFILLVSTAANAYTIVESSPGVVTGIGGLDIGGVLYNVDFQTDVYSTFGGVEDFWSSASEVDTAVGAIVTVMSSEGVAALNNGNTGIPAVFFSISHPTSPTANAGQRGLVTAGVWQVIGCSDNLSDVKAFLGTTGLTAWSVVPLPAAVWLFGSGLALLGWLRRRQAA